MPNASMGSGGTDVPGGGGVRVTAIPVSGQDGDSAPFWAGLADHRVVVQGCPACLRRRMPPMPSCPYCAAPGAEALEVAGTGTVYSWVRVHRAMSEAMADEVPYCIVTVDLDGGGRLFGRLAGTGPVAIGARVIPAFADHDTWTELRFAVADVDPPGAGTAP